MNKQEMIAKIFKIQKKIDKDIPMINSGGCARFAIRTHRALNKIGIENEMRIDLGSHSLPGIKANKKNIKNLKNLNHWDKENLSFSHAWIYIPSMDINFDGENISTEGEVFHGNTFNGTYNAREMAIIIMVGDWNKSYNPKYNTKLSRIIYSTIK